MRGLATRNKRSGGSNACSRAAGETRLDRARSGLRQPARRPAVQDAAGQTEVISKTEVEEAAVMNAVRTGDASAFAALAERYRRELHVHCYRMLGSFDDAEDLVQETFLRAWRARERFQGGPRVRAWVYRLATNACLDARRTRRRLPALHSYAEVPWLQPYPDRLLDEIAPGDTEPGA